MPVSDQNDACESAPLQPYRQEVGPGLGPETQTGLAAERKKRVSMRHFEPWAHCRKDFWAGNAPPAQQSFATSQPASHSMRCPSLCGGSSCAIIDGKAPRTWHEQTQHAVWQKLLKTLLDKTNMPCALLSRTGSQAMRPLRVRKRSVTAVKVRHILFARTSLAKTTDLTRSRLRNLW